MSTPLSGCRPVVVPAQGPNELPLVIEQLSAPRSTISLIFSGFSFPQFFQPGIGHPGMTAILSRI